MCLCLWFYLKGKAPFITPCEETHAATHHTHGTAISGVLVKVTVNLTPALLSVSGSVAVTFVVITIVSVSVSRSTGDGFLSVHFPSPT